MDVIDALLMGLLQGLTEYLPVSSSGHLAIASHFFGIEGEAKLFALQKCADCLTFRFMWLRYSARW